MLSNERGNESEAQVNRDMGLKFMEFVRVSFSFWIWCSLVCFFFPLLKWLEVEGHKICAAIYTVTIKIFIVWFEAITIDNSNNNNKRKIPKNSMRHLKWVQVIISNNKNNRNACIAFILISFPLNSYQILFKWVGWTHFHFLIVFTGLFVYTLR